VPVRPSPVPFAGRHQLAGALQRSVGDVGAADERGHLCGLLVVVEPVDLRLRAPALYLFRDAEVDVAERGDLGEVRDGDDLW